MKTKTVKIGSTLIGGSHFAVFAGPCSIESEKQAFETAEYVKSKGACVIRGGVYKLRTSPNSFQGLGEKAFSIVKKIRTELNVPFVTEVTDPRQIPDLAGVVDAFQVGSRNMHNYELLKELGQTKTPIILKRGFCATVDEWLKAADYLVQGGNEDIVFCERGIRSFETVTRNTFDINAIVYIKQRTEFPIIADPSHGTGISDFVTPVALAAASAGADGVMVEVHPEPSKALSDGFQALDFENFDQMMTQLKNVLSVFNKKLGSV